MSDDFFQAYLSEEEERSQKLNALKYGGYSKKLLFLGEEAQKSRHMRKGYIKKLKFRPDLDCEAQGQGREIRISPELTVVWEKIKRIRDPKECEHVVRQLLECPETEGGCRIIQTDKLRQELERLAEGEENDSLRWMWYAVSTDGIEIHPGVSDSDEPEAVLLGDDSVHALMAGRTGSGKSVALHAIITGLLQEYAPWELNINLADFKIVELSKYGNAAQHKAPHVMKIAATDSMEYVLSVMYDMYEKMDIRQKVFAALGLQKLSDYRKKFNVVLPREILIVDEFQQMYELASARQIRMINQLIKMITKLGRATGYHLFFASQSMSDTIGNDVIANFKLRLCLSASSEVSAKVLGNDAASKLTGLKGKGYLITNNEGGLSEYNKEYQVPFVEEREDGNGDLTDVLRWNAKLADAIGYQKDLDFYKEDYHRRFTGGEDSFEGDLLHFSRNAAGIAAQREEIDFYLLLGDSCVYAKNAQKNTALEYCPIKNGDRKNIVCAGDSIEQRAYMLRLLQLQYITNSRLRPKQPDKNFIVHGDMMVKEVLASEDKVYTEAFKEISLKDFTQTVRNCIMSRRLLYTFAQYPKEERIPEKMYEVVSQTYKGSYQERFSALIRKKAITQEDADRRITELLQDRARKLLENYNQNTMNDTVSYQFQKEGHRTFWVNGFHMIADLLADWCRGKSPMADLLKSCTNMGIRFIFAGTSLAELPMEIRRCMGYYFVMSNDEKNFFHAGLEPGKDYRDDIVHFRAEKEVLNKQKPGLYILGQDEKIVKMYEMEDSDIGNIERELFQGIKG